MTQRSIQTTSSPTVIIRAGLDVRVRVWPDERVMATTNSRWGMKVERRGQAIEVSIGSSGEVSVPVNSTVKIYAGKTADVQGIQGSVSVVAGWKAIIRDVDTLVHLTAGGGADVDCRYIGGSDLKFTAGGNLRFYIRSLTDAHLMVNDVGGYWEGVIGSGRTKIILKAGGDAIIVTDQTVVAQPPSYVLGTLERPAGK